MTRVYVCPLAELENTLQTSDAHWMISLSSPGKAPPCPPQIDGGFLSLEFNDIGEERDGLIAPHENHISQLFEFFESWNQQGALLIHCWMGISRSTAAALLACAYFDRKQDMEALVKRLREASPMATPNPLMIQIGDGMLGLDGALTRAVDGIGRGAEASVGTPFYLELSP